MKTLTVLNGLTNLNARLVRDGGVEYVELFIRLPAGRYGVPEKAVRKRRARSRSARRKLPRKRAKR